MYFDEANKICVFDLLRRAKGSETSKTARRSHSWSPLLSAESPLKKDSSRPLPWGTMMLRQNDKTRQRLMTSESSSNGRMCKGDGGLCFREQLCFNRHCRDVTAIDDFGFELESMNTETLLSRLRGEEGTGSTLWCQNQRSLRTTSNSSYTETGALCLGERAGHCNSSSSSGAWGLCLWERWMMLAVSARLDEYRNTIGPASGQRGLGLTLLFVMPKSTMGTWELALLAWTDDTSNASCTNKHRASAQRRRALCVDCGEQAGRNGYPSIKGGLCLGERWCFDTNRSVRDSSWQLSIQARSLNPNRNDANSTTKIKPQPARRSLSTYLDQTEERTDDRRGGDEFCYQSMIQLGFMMMLMMVEMRDDADIRQLADLQQHMLHGNPYHNWVMEWMNLLSNLGGRAIR